MANQSKAELLNTLRVLLREALTLRAEGAAHPRLTRASGAVDGYMRALLDAGIVDQKELLSVVAAERAASFGAATATVVPDPAFLAA